MSVSVVCCPRSHRNYQPPVTTARGGSLVVQSRLKRFVDLRDRLAPSPWEPWLKGVGIVLPGTAVKPHPTADIRFPANLAARARPAPAEGITG